MIDKSKNLEEQFMDIAHVLYARNVRTVDVTLHALVHPHRGLQAANFCLPLQRFLVCSLCL